MDLKSGGRAFLIIRISFSGMVEEDVLMWRVVTESVRPYAFFVSINRKYRNNVSTLLGFHH